MRTRPWLLLRSPAPTSPAGVHASADSVPHAPVSSDRHFDGPRHGPPDPPISGSWSPWAQTLSPTALDSDLPDQLHHLVPKLHRIRLPRSSHRDTSFTSVWKCPPTRGKINKGLSPSYQQPLAALATEYIKSHNAKIEHLLGGEGSFTTVVPSTRGVSFEDQPLTKTLQLAHALRDHVRQTLAHVTGETIARGSYRPEGFVPQGEAVEGQRIVLIEDLWVSGATCVSAAGALLSAGAESVVILVLARQIRDNPNFVPAEYREAMGLQYDVTSWPRD